MSNIRELLARSSLGSIGVFILCLTVAIRVAIVPVPDLRPAVENLRSASDAVNKATWAIQGTLSGARKDGSDGALYEVHQTLRAVTTAGRETALTTGVVRQAAVIERDQLRRDGPILDAMLTDGGRGIAALSKTAGELGTLTADVRTKTVPAITGAVDSLNTEVRALDPTIQSAGRAASNLADLTGDPAMKAAVANVAAGTQSLNLSLFGADGKQGTMALIQDGIAHGDHMVGVIDTTMSNLLNPKKRSFWGAAAVAAAKALIPKPVFNFAPKAALNGYGAAVIH